MGSLALAQLISLVLAVAAIGATGGFVASAVARRKKRRARGVFFLGFFCGLMAGSILLARRRGRKALGAVARGVDLRTLRASTGAGIGRFDVHTLPLAASRVRSILSPLLVRRPLQTTARDPRRAR
jgi:hypothetical protein